MADQIHHPPDCPLNRYLHPLNCPLNRYLHPLNRGTVPLCEFCLGHDPERDRLRDEIVSLEDREAQALDWGARNFETYKEAAADRDRLVAALALTSENLDAIHSVTGIPTDMIAEVLKVVISREHHS
jgi:hypothetical protein